MKLDSQNINWEVVYLTKGKLQICIYFKNPFSDQCLMFNIKIKSGLVSTTGTLTLYTGFQAKNDQ